MNKDKARIKNIICSTCNSFLDCEHKCKARDRVADALIADGFTKYNGENDYKQRLAASEERYQQLSNISVEAIEKKNKRIKELQIQNEKFEQNMTSVLEIEKKNTVREFAEKLKANEDLMITNAFDLNELIDVTLKEYESE